MLRDDLSDGREWRFFAYKALVRRVNYLFTSFLGDYCSHCQSVIERLPEAEDESFDLVAGVYPGCCHRGAGDIFRLEGEIPERSHLAPEIIAGLRRERELLLRGLDVDNFGGTYQLRRHRDDTLIKGAHCRYFTDQGCSLGVLKGPLCINFICPPLRADLLEVCADRDLLGPESDFLFIYRSLAIISYESRDEVIEEMTLLRQRVGELGDCCRQFLAVKGQCSIYDCFNR